MNCILCKGGRASSICSSFAKAKVYYTTYYTFSSIIRQGESVLHIVYFPLGANRDCSIIRQGESVLHYVLQIPFHHSPRRKCITHCLFPIRGVNRDCSIIRQGESVLHIVYFPLGANRDCSIIRQGESVLHIVYFPSEGLVEPLIIRQGEYPVLAYYISCMSPQSLSSFAKASYGDY